MGRFQACLYLARCLRFWHVYHRNERGAYSMRTTIDFHYPLAFTTLACPDWSWEQAIQRAVEYGYQGLELRGVEGEMDLTKAAPFTASPLPATKRELKKRGLAIPCLDTSCRFS